MPYKTKKSKTKSGKKTAKNPCRVIRVKRKTGKSKLDRVVYARRKVCFNPSADANMYTNITSFIIRDPKKIDFMRAKYGPFLSGVFDDMDATYASELRKKPGGMLPGDFYNWYMENDIDLRNAREIISMKETDERFKQDMKEFIIHVEAFNKKQQGVFAQLISRLRRKNPSSSSQVLEKLEILSSSKIPVTVQMENVRDFTGIIKSSNEYKGWFRVTNPITYRFIYFNISDVLSVNGIKIEVNNYLINTTPSKRSHLTLL